jgi:hypothetical protein
MCTWNQIPCTRESKLVYDSRVVMRMVVLCDQYVGAWSYLSCFHYYKLCGATQSWDERVNSRDTAWICV